MTSGMTSYTNITASNSIQFGTVGGLGGVNSALIGPSVGGLGIGINGSSRSGFGMSIVGNNGGSRSFDPILLSPTLTSISTNLSALTIPSPGLNNSSGGVGNPDNSQLNSNSNTNRPIGSLADLADLEDVDFIDSFEGQQEHYGV